MGLDKKLKAKLDKAKGAWKKAKTRAATEKSGFDEIEDGRYLARLVSFEIGESKSSSRVQMMTEWKLQEGDYKGQSKRNYDGLESEDNLVYVAKFIGRLGYEAPDDLDSLDALMKEIVAEKPLARIRLKTRGEFQNVYVDQVFDKDDEDEILAEAASEAEAGDEEEEETEETEETDEAEEEEESDDDAEEEEADEEAEEDEASDDEVEVELTVGTKVLAPYKGKKKPGKVIEILDDDKVRVKMDDGGKVVRVAIDELEGADDAEEEDDEEDVPEAPATKKVAGKKKEEPKKAVKKGKK